MARTIALLLLLASAGCVQYRHVILDPPDLAQTVGRQDDAVFSTDAGEYRMRTVEEKLVIRVFNQSAEPMQISPTRSVVVAPDGQSHPILGLTIAPGSFVKLILPPSRPVYRSRASGLSFGFGYSSAGYQRYRGGRYGSGVGFSSRHYYGPWDGPGYYEPEYRVSDDSNPVYWDWPAGQQITLTLSYDRGAKQTTDRFVILREADR